MDNAHLLVAVLLLLAPTTPVAATDELIGHWRGAVVRDGAVVVVELDVATSAVGLSGQLTALDWELVDAPVALRWQAPELQVQLEAGPARAWRLLLHPDAGELAGRVEDAGGALTTVHLVRAPRPPGRTIVREEVGFDVGAVHLQGTLVRPAGSGPHPGLLFLSGRSYPSREDGLAVATWLAYRGLACLVFDGRGTGASGGERSATTAEDRLADGLAALQLLASRDDLRRDQLGLYGSSAGGWVATLLARRTELVSFLVLEVAPAVGVVAQQGHGVRYRMLWSGENFTAEELDAAEAYQRRLVAAWVAGPAARWEELRPAVAAAARARWSTFVDLPSGPDDPELAFFQRQPYDNTEALRATTVPVLALYGERDALVPPQENVPALEAALAVAGNRDSTIVVFPRAVHGLFVPAAELGADKAWPERLHRWARKAPGSWDVLADWLDAHVDVAP